MYLIAPAFYFFKNCRVVAPAPALEPEPNSAPVLPRTKCHPFQSVESGFVGCLEDCSLASYFKNLYPDLQVFLPS